MGLQACIPISTSLLTHGMLPSARAAPFRLSRRLRVEAYAAVYRQATSRMKSRSAASLSISCSAVNSFWPPLSRLLYVGISRRRHASRFARHDNGARTLTIAKLQDKEMPIAIISTLLRRACHRFSIISARRSREDEARTSQLRELLTCLSPPAPYFAGSDFKISAIYTLYTLADGACLTLSPGHGDDCHARPCQEEGERPRELPAGARYGIEVAMMTGRAPRAAAAAVTMAIRVCYRQVTPLEDAYAAFNYRGRRAQSGATTRIRRAKKKVEMTGSWGASFGRARCATLLHRRASRQL